jgi:AcrR family transcriptional regulator
MAFPGRPRRADAVRSAALVLDAAIRVLNDRPDASMSDVARAAGVTRQTVYAHYPTREALLSAVVDRVTQEFMAVFSDSAVDQGDPRDALVRLLDASWRMTVERFPLLLAIAPPPDSVTQSLDRHQGVLEPFEALMRRGQSIGVFDRNVPPTWLVTLAVTLTDAAWAEVTAGRLTADQGRAFSQAAVLRAVTA